MNPGEPFTTDRGRNGMREGGSIQLVYPDRTRSTKSPWTVSGEHMTPIKMRVDNVSPIVISETVGYTMGWGGGEAYR